MDGANEPLVGAEHHNIAAVDQSDNHDAEPQPYAALRSPARQSACSTATCAFWLEYELRWRGRSDFMAFRFGGGP